VGDGGNPLAWVRPKLGGMVVGVVTGVPGAGGVFTSSTVVIGHENDLIHPFSDAENLAQQVPNAQLVQARSMFELRLEPERLTGEIVRFLDEVYAADPSSGSRDAEDVGELQETI
jgi:hypothetical protein